jgi:long-chain acyl-CoA synthetase
VSKVNDVLCGWAQRNQSRLMIIDLQDDGFRKEVSYHDAVLKIAEWSLKIECLDSTRIGLILENNVNTILLFYAILKAKKDVVLIDPEWGVGTIRNVVLSAEIKICLAAKIDSHIGIVCPIFNADAVSNLFFRKSNLYTNVVHPEGKILIFTSGTTSSPKGIILTQAALLYAYKVGKESLRLDESIRSACLYRISGLGILGINFLFPHSMGGTTVIFPPYSYHDFNELWIRIKEEGISLIYLVPPIINYIIGNHDLSTFQYNPNILCLSGAAKLDVSIQNKFQAFLAPLANIYGLSECGFAFLFGDKIANDCYSNSVGYPIGIEIKIMDNDSDIKNINQVGMLYVKTDSVFEGYLSNPKATLEVLKDGWLKTNDLGYLNESGAVYLVGRVDDTINKGGNLFHLAETEEFIRTLPDVSEVVCIKVPCDIYGEDYVAVVRPKPLCDLEKMPKAISDLCREHLGRARSPRTIYLHENALAKNGAGKYQKNSILSAIEKTLP